MTDSPSSMTEKERRHQRRGRILAVALMSVVALPMLVAYVLYHTGVGIPDGQVNQGELLEPPQRFADWAPRTLDGEPWERDPDKKRWRYVVPVMGDCDQPCRDNLYLTRQVHVRLAEKAYRVKRVIMPLDGAPSEDFLTFLEQEHPGTDVVQPQTHAVREALAETNLPEEALNKGHYFLMDQDGFVMMAYNPEHKGNQLLKDIKRLLRYSYEE